jgi:hypothetical protein
MTKSIKPVQALIPPIKVKIEKYKKWGQSAMIEGHIDELKQVDEQLKKGLAVIEAFKGKGQGDAFLKKSVEAWMEHNEWNKLGDGFVIRYIEASANVALQFARFNALAALFSKKGTTATMMNRVGKTPGAGQAAFSVRTLESVVTRIMRTIKLDDMKRPDHADSVINLAESLEALGKEQLMGGRELNVQCRVLRIMVSAIRNEEVSAQDLQWASEEINVQRQLMDGPGGQGTVKPLLRAMLVLPAGSWMSEKVVEMAGEREEEANVESSMKQLEEHHEALPALVVSCADSLGAWKAMQAEIAAVKKSLPENCSESWSDRVTAVEMQVQNSVTTYGREHAVQFAHHIVEKAVQHAKEGGQEQAVGKLTPEHRALLLGLQDQR